MSQSPGTPRKRRWPWLMPTVVALGTLFGLGALLWPAIRSAREAARRASCIGQNKFFGLDMHNYYERNQHFPPAYLADKDGRPAHSWRILLLQSDLGELYDQYHFDESWDSPHNSALAGGLPIGMSGVSPWYHCASDCDPDRLDTSYVMAVGSETFTSGPTGRRMEEFTEGTAHTITIAEMSESGIPWMEPRDLDFDTMSFKINDPNGRGIRSKHPGVVVVQFADGSARCLNEDIDPEVLKSLLRISGPKDVSALFNY